MSSNQMKVGTRVMKEKVLKTQNALGTIVKKTNEYTVVKWDGINGNWHYIPAQAESLEVINNDEE